jgi:hypothetical protein
MCIPHTVHPLFLTVGTRSDQGIVLDTTRDAKVWPCRDAAEESYERGYVDL